jgi:hypothetical protein
VRIRPKCSAAPRDRIEKVVELPRERVATCVYHAYNKAVVASTFDPKKNATNLHKHGVSLAVGDGVLNDPLAITVEDLSAVGEQRFATIGRNAFGRCASLRGCEKIPRGL